MIHRRLSLAVDASKVAASRNLFAARSIAYQRLPSIIGVRVYSSSSPDAPPAKKEKEPLMDRIKHEVKHYVNGTKLLGYEIKISTKLLVKFGQGYELTRRERNQLKRTMSDVFRLVPFSAFIVIPFAELLLPIALKIFPNLLPSTYESGKDKLAKRDKLLETRRKTSSFLHETLEESNLLNYNSIENTEKKETFLSFFRKLYSASNKDKTDLFTHGEILTIAKMFKNDTILDNLSRPQLVAICKFMSLRPFGNDNLLRYQIRYQLKSIIQDDITIDYEGISTMSPEELHQACVSRGIKAFGTSQEDLTNTLKVWLDLRLREKVPSVLMVLCSTFVFGGVSKTEASKVASVIDPSIKQTRYYELLDLYYEGILQVLSSIPDPVYNVAKLDVTESKATSEEKEAKAETVEKETTEIPLTPSVSSTTGSATKAATSQPLNVTATSITPKILDTEVEEIVEEKPEEEKLPTHRDNSEFKLNVLREQEEMIKKEEEEAKARKIREQVADDINLDEDDSSPQLQKSAEAKTVQDKKSPGA